ncbi:hypothetical protein HQ590_08930 [bacterium]|nr:hypothetical protein [bacterium]
MPKPNAQTVDLGLLPRPFLNRHPDWVKLYEFAWRLAATHIRHSRGRWHMDAAWDPNRNYQWVWDTVFMTLYCRYGNGQYPGIQSLDNFYELQRRDGYISMTYDLNAGKEPWPGYINPPLFAWAEWEYYRTTGDATRLKRVVPHIEKLMAWIDAHHRNEPHRRHSPPQGALVRRGGPRAFYQLFFFKDAGSSGMDDSPRAPRMPQAGRFFDWIDLSSQMTHSFRLLGRMHAVLGRKARAAHWEKRARDTGGLINDELWCERTRFYHDRMLPQNFVAAKTAAGFWPVLAGICSRPQLESLVSHLRDPRVFNRPIMVPSLAADDPNYSPQGTYWTGGVWAPTNYMIARGLMLAGQGDEAHRIAVNYLHGLARTYQTVTPHTLWECYCPESCQPGRAAYTGKRVKPHFVGWTGLGPIAMLIENVLGIDVDAPARKLVWDVRLTEEHGIDNLGFGDGRVALRCARRASPRARARVEVRSDVDLTVMIRCAGRKRTARVRPGRVLRLTV